MASFKQVNPAGRYRIVRRGFENRWWKDIYHRLLSLGWLSFLSVFVLYYLIMNSVFACAYWLLGPGALDGTSSLGQSLRYWDDFFFSVQTFATIGYGRITPVGIGANLLVTVEALVGLMTLALATGLFFARFSRPTARVIFSRVALITMHDGVPSLLFRIANERRNQIVEAQVRVILSCNETTAEGEVYRNFYDLKLERSHSGIFALTWTVVHPIDKDSPLWGRNGILTQAELEAMQAEIIVSLIGTDDLFSQTVHARYSYPPERIVRGARFRDILIRSEADATVTIDLPHIHDVIETA